MKRRPSREWLDDDAGTPPEIAASIRDLRWFNRWFGGVGTVRRLLRDAAALSGKRWLDILEAASGDGYLPNLMRAEFARQGIDLRFTLLDRSPQHLPRNGTAPKIAADALRLPFNDGSFDFVSCSLVVHHFSPQEVVAFAKEGLRVSRRGLLIHDLIRNPLHLGAAYAGVPLYRSRITRNDAPASVRQAYTVAEMTDLLRQAGAGGILVRRSFFFRMGIFASKDL